MADVLLISIVEQILLVSIFSGELDLIHWDLASNETFYLRAAWELVCCSKLRDEIFSII